MVVPEFIKNPDTELGSFLKINSENLKEITKLKSKIIKKVDGLKGPPQIYDNEQDLAKSKQQIVSTINKLQELVKLQQQKKILENTVHNLENNLQETNSNIINLKTNKNSECEDYKRSLKLLHVAKRYYDSNFSTKIITENQDEETFIAIVTFVINGQESNYPLKFFINREQKQVTRFDVGSLLNERQEQALQARFKESNNVLALFSTLRAIALKKCC